jgi:predicted N-formylglutamate amidohydrolase
MQKKILITCEHGGNQIPSWLAKSLEIPQEILHSHRGLDIGALSVAKLLEGFSDGFFFSEISRLCIELNRSLYHSGLFSEYSKNLSQDLKKKLVQEIYLPYRNEIELQVKTWVKAGFQVIHLSIHSFTPSLNGVVRDADIGLLYDPARRYEKKLCRQWAKNIIGQTEQEAIARVRMNYPYRGTADGFTTYLRQKIKGGYLGIEVEINQKLFLTLSPTEIKNQLFCEAFFEQVLSA